MASYTPIVHEGYIEQNAYFEVFNFYDNLNYSTATVFILKNGAGVPSSYLRYDDSSTDLPYYDVFLSLKQSLIDKGLYIDGFHCFISARNGHDVHKVYCYPEYLGFNNSFIVPKLQSNKIISYIFSNYDVAYSDFRQEQSSTKQTKASFFIDGFHYFYYQLRAYDVQDSNQNGPFNYTAYDYMFISNDTRVVQEKKCCIAECFGITE